MVVVGRRKVTSATPRGKLVGTRGSFDLIGWLNASSVNPFEIRLDAKYTHVGCSFACAVL